MVSMFRNNANLLVIAVIVLVNALGYGIIIPVLYSYSQRFGMTDFQNGLLFAAFSAGQFLSTPIIGRLSDKYGRKPLLIFSIAGTAVSFLLMAFAPNALVLFLARALDGITAGNIPVASAVISDTTQVKDRAKGFGIIGASFGFGFVFGPTIAALTVGYNMALPFLIAAAVSIFAVLLTAFVLPETNKHKGLARHGKLFDFVHLAKALVDERVGTTLGISFLYSFAFSLFIYAYQPFSVKVLQLTPTQIAINFTLFGLVGVISQAAIIPRVSKRLGDTRTLSTSLGLAILTFLSFFVLRSTALFMLVSLFHALANGFVNPMIQTLLSKEVEAHSQGSIQGINASYMSIGMIVGPVAGGALATLMIPMPFLGGAVLVFVCFLLSQIVTKRAHARHVAI